LVYNASGEVRKEARKVDVLPSLQGARFGGKGESKVTMLDVVPGPMALVLQASTQTGSGLALFLPLVLVMGVFYFLMILPAQRKQKKVQEMLGQLKNGDKVITNSGIYGTIVGLEDDAVQLRIAEQVKIKISRNAIAALQFEPKEN